MDVHAGNSLSYLIWENFNDYSGKIGETPINRSRTQSLGVGENPLNRKGTLLTRNGEDEEIVYSSYESMRCVKYTLL